MVKLSQQLLSALRDQIGTRGKYQGRDYELIEVIEHEPAVVLRDCGAKHVIQNDMHGEAHRFVQETHTVAVFSEASDKLHPVLEEFFLPPIFSKLSAIGAITETE